MAKNETTADNFHAPWADGWDFSKYPEVKATRRVIARTVKVGEVEELRKQVADLKSAVAWQKETIAARDVEIERLKAAYDALIEKLVDKDADILKANIIAEKKIAGLREALEPFAAFCEVVENRPANHGPTVLSGRLARLISDPPIYVTVDDFRRARAALEALK